MFDLVPFGNGSGSIFDSFDPLMNDNFWKNAEPSFSSFRTDIVDQGDKYLLKADLPGFQKQEIHIEVDGDRLTLSAEHKADSGEDKKNYIRRERKYGSVSRSFSMEGINADKITASYKNGVLELELPKLEKEQVPEKTIEVR